MRKPAIKAAIREFMDVLTEKSIVTREMIVEGMLDIAQNGSNESARMSAWKALSDFTGGFDSNKQKIELDLSDKSKTMGELQLDIHKLHIRTEKIVFRIEKLKEDVER